MASRPSKREIIKRLREAKEALCERQLLFANAAKAVGELYELEIGDSEELKLLLLQLLEEIRLEHYAGHCPPQKSYEGTIANCELWAFSWKSHLLDKTMYLKFVIKESCFYYVSLHESRQKRGELGSWNA